MRIVVTLATIIGAISVGHAQAQYGQRGCVPNFYGRPICPPAQQSGQGGCLTDSFGQTLCSPPGGGIVINEGGQAACGVGACGPNGIGQFVCSARPGGYVTRDFGRVLCTGGCELASISRCQRPQ